MSGRSRALVALGALAFSALSPCRRRHRLTKNTPPPWPTPTTPVPAPAPADQSNIDIAYGAFQRGHYITAFNEANKLRSTERPHRHDVARRDLRARTWRRAATMRRRRNGTSSPLRRVTATQCSRWPCSIFRAAPVLAILSKRRDFSRSAAKLGHAGACL